MKKLKVKLYNLLRWSEKYTKTDMIYLARGGFWLTSNRILGAITALALAIVYANLLPKESYGLYKYVLSIIGIIVITALPGMNGSLARSIVRGYEGSVKKVIKTKFKWSIIGVMIGLGISMYYFYNENTVLGISFLIAGILSPITSSFVYGPYFEAKKMFKQAAIYSSISQILIAGLIIATLLFSPNVISLILVYFVSLFLIQLTFFYLVFKKNKLNDKEDPEVISLGKHLSVMNVLGVISNQIDKILMWHFVGPVQLAVYSFATVPITQFQSLLKSVPILAFPKIASQDTNVLKKTLPKKIFKFSLILVIPTVLYILAAPFLFKIIFPEYMDSVKYSQYFALILLLFPFRMFSHPLLAQAKKKSLYIEQTVTPIIKISLLFILLPIYGIIGAIAALMISSIIGSATVYYLFKKM